MGFCCILQAVDDMNGKELDGRQVYVGLAQKEGNCQELKRRLEQKKRERMTRYQVSLLHEAFPGSHANIVLVR